MSFGIWHATDTWKVGVLSARYGFGRGGGGASYFVRVRGILCWQLRVLPQRGCTVAYSVAQVPQHTLVEIVVICAACLHQYVHQWLLLFLVTESVQPVLGVVHP